MAEPQTFTMEQVESMARAIREQERGISALCTAIQRSVIAEDNPEYTDALRKLLQAVSRGPQAAPAPAAEAPATGEDDGAEPEE